MTEKKKLFSAKETSVERNRKFRRDCVFLSHFSPPLYGENEVATCAQITGKKGGRKKEGKEIIIREKSVSSRQGKKWENELSKFQAGFFPPSPPPFWVMSTKEREGATPQEKNQTRSFRQRSSNVLFFSPPFFAFSSVTETANLSINPSLSLFRPLFLPKTTLLEEEEGEGEK